MHVFGVGADLVFGEAAERLTDELEVVGEMRRSGAVLHALVGERFEELGRAVFGDERHRRRERVALGAPRLAAPERASGDIVHRVGHVRAGEHRLHLAVLAVTAHDAGALDRGGRVGEVVRDRLVPVERGNRKLAVLG